MQKQKTRVDEMLDSSPYAQEFKTSGAKSSLVDKVKAAHGITRQNTKGAADKVAVRSFGRRDSATANGTENRRKSTNNSKLNDRIQEKQTRYEQEVAAIVADCDRKFANQT